MRPDFRNTGLALFALAGLLAWTGGSAAAGESDTTRVMRDLEETRAERQDFRDRQEHLRSDRSTRQESRSEARARADAERAIRRRDFPEDRTTSKYRQRIEPLGTVGRPR